MHCIFEKYEWSYLIIEINDLTPIKISNFVSNSDIKLRWKTPSSLIQKIWNYSTKNNEKSSLAYQTHLKSQLTNSITSS